MNQQSSQRKHRPWWRRWWFWTGVGLLVVIGGTAGAIAYVHHMVDSWGPPPLETVFVEVPLPESHTYELNGGRQLHTMETGKVDGPLVIFVHGTPGGCEDFVWVMCRPELASRARLVSVDRLGWGDSATGGLEPSMQAEAEALRPVLDAHPANLPAIVVGHSLGAAVAGKLAMIEPERVGALVIVAGSIDPALEETMWYQAVTRVWPIRPLIPEPLTRSDDELIPFKQELEAMQPGWAQLRMPVTVVQGDADGLVPPANADFAEREITNAPLTMERIPNVGHLIPWEHPELIVDAVLEYVDQDLPQRHEGM